MKRERIGKIMAIVMLAIMLISTLASLVLI